MGFENLIDSFTNFFSDLKNDKLVMFILIVLISLYASLWVHALKDYTIKIFTNKYIRLLIFVLISYIASGNPALGVILAIAVLVTLETITREKLTNSEKFTPSNNDIGNNYLSNPLLKQDELPLAGNSLNLKLRTPKQMYQHMVKQGRVLLNDSLEIKNDIKNRFDSREEKIANIAERDGKMLVQSGMNRLQPADNGEYISWVDNQSVLSEMSNDDKLSAYNKSSYVKYDKFIDNYSNNEKIMELFNILKIKYGQIVNNNSFSQSDFDIKLNEVYDTEFELLMAIAEIKNKTLKEADVSKINTKIEMIKQLRASRSESYHSELNLLSELLCL